LQRQAVIVIFAGTSLILRNVDGNLARFKDIGKLIMLFSVQKVEVKRSRIVCRHVWDVTVCVGIEVAKKLGNYFYLE